MEQPEETLEIYYKYSFPLQ